MRNSENPTGTNTMKQFKSGQYISQGYYKSFQPEFINKQLQIDNMEILQLLSQADRELGRLDMYSKYIPNVELFISMHVLKEATQSSKIEGTQTNMDEALLDKAQFSVKLGTFIFWQLKRWAKYQHGNKNRWWIFWRYYYK